MVPWLQRLLGRRTPLPLPIISADANGFTLTVRHRTRSVAWEVVRKVSAYKETQESHDQVVLLIEVLRLRHAVIALPEGCPGFAQLFGPMEEALGINPWPYLELMSATREPIPTVLYLRSEEPPFGSIPG